MTTKLKTELFIEDDLGNESVIYPFVESDHVSFDNGMTIDNMIAQDVSTPIVVHDTSSFKVGVGDSDISNSIVDSSVGSMTIKGQTYQNILPDPSLRNKTNGNAMQKFNKGYDSVNVVDGVVKSAILSGQTLVNLANTKSGSIVSSNHTDTKCSYLKNATTYTIFLNLKTINTSKSLIMAQYIGGAVKQNLFLTELSLGLNKKKITTTVELDKLTIFNASSYGGETVEFDELMIIEGNYTSQDIPYFTGMASSKMPVLSSIGKNLINRVLKGKTSQEKYDEMTATSYDWFSSTMLKPNTTYTLSYIYQDTQINSRGVTIRTYDVNKNLVRSAVYSPIFTTQSNEYYIQGHTQGLGYEQSDIKIQLEQGSVITTYEPHKTNILSTPSDLVLRGIGSVSDTLNVNTGEIVLRNAYEMLKDITWSVRNQGDGTTTISFNGVLSSTAIGTQKTVTAICDGFTLNNTSTDGIEGFGIEENTKTLYIEVKRDKLSGLTANDFKTYLSDKTWGIVYQTVTNTIKTVDLSSSGNWEKVVLNGSEDWQISGWSVYPNTYAFNTTLALQSVILGTSNTFSNKLNLVSNLANVDVEGYVISLTGKIAIRCNRDKLSTLDLAGFKQYLSQNPITVWYQTTTSQANSIKETMSFANGHIQLSSGVENSLIPSLDYEVPTSNSYHLDLAKTSTKYTMKNMSGTFTIDGTQYNASTNGVFTTPSAMSNKLMVTSAIQSNAMLLEGDVTNKTLPYFKGIKSAFEDKDKIEVLSQRGVDSNSTIIPLLKPLKSLLSGVCDEIIVNGQENKAKIIRRVDIVDGKLVQLATPTTIETDIEGFPYVYKNGHIFLNTDISPKTIVKYSINQSHVISSQNSDLVRHEKETDYLYKLIGEYVRVSYESTLLTLDLELK